MHPPNIETITQNTAALGVALVVLLLLSQLFIAALLRVADRLLRSPLFAELTEEDRDAFRRQVRRGTLFIVTPLCLALAAGAVVATVMGLRVMDLLKTTVGHTSREDLLALGPRAAKALSVLLAALILDVIVRALVSVMSRGLERSAWLKTRNEALSSVFTRLRTALRTAIFGGAATMIADALGVPEGVRRLVVLVVYVLVSFYASRLLVSVAHLAVDVFFDLSARLSRLENPLKYVGNLTHLAGITKRAVEYFVYVGAATWVADQLTPGTWLSRVGRVGIRIIAVFYASRVLLEVCLLLMNELFLTTAPGQSEASIQQRKTLVPVAAGFLRYGIYFSAIVMSLREADIDPTPLLAGAGVVGVAIGLGAQAFVGDIVAGFFILFENLLLVGDVVEVSGVKGVVEEVGVRISKLRDDAGVLHAIPNGEVRKVSSYSQKYVNAVVDVHVPYDEDLPRVRGLLASVSSSIIAAETGVQSPVEVKVQELADVTVLFRVVARVPPGKDEDIGDALRLHILEKLRAEGVGAPHARRVVLLDGGGLSLATPASKKPTEEKKAEEKKGRPEQASDEGSA